MTRNRSLEAGHAHHCRVSEVIHGHCDPQFDRVRTARSTTLIYETLG